MDLHGGGEVLQTDIAVRAYGVENELDLKVSRRPFRNRWVEDAFRMSLLFRTLMVVMTMVMSQRIFIRKQQVLDTNHCRRRLSPLQRFERRRIPILCLVGSF